jgi:hypothetical protein
MGVFPDTRRDLEAAGYRYTGAGRCRSCGVELSWFETPRGKNMPMSAVEGTEDREHRVLEPHWKSCSDADHFRKKKT